ncbi:MAG: Mur ligase family protein [Candidatus Nanopelagicales bacterium]|jgi:cyanophycin synthetase|nr:Mur ligase family protein [Candidatus Nanopelagicales bacterium]
MGLVELRVLVGPNPDIPAPAVRVTLAQPDQPGLDGAVLAAVTDRIAQEAGVDAGPAVTRPGPDGTVVVAFPWQRDGSGRAVAEALVSIVEADPAVPLDERIAAAVAHVRAADPGDPPDVLDPLVPTVAVTGTNGKTTTTRLLGRMAGEAGLLAAWSSTDGVFVAGRCVEPGDWSGPGGARRVLATQGLDFAVLETARGGLMLRGMGVAAVDVAVFTNVSPDHLGLQGIDTVEQLAWAKSTVVRVVRPGGWAVLNADDPLVRQYHDAGPGSPWWFALDPAGEGAELARRLGGPLASVVGGRMVVSGWQDSPVDLGSVLDVPVTIAGLSRENVANALAAASAGLAIGLPVEAVRAGLASFAPDPTTSPGRMNIWSVPTTDGGSATVILDFAHNEAGAEALLRVGAGLRPPGGALHVSIGNAGDRTDEGIAEVARLAGAAADSVQLAAKSHYLRGRTQAEIDALQRAGLASVGKTPIEETPDEPSGLRALLARARDGDVLAMMIHQDREACVGLLEGVHATPDDPATIRAKAASAHR